MRVLFLCAGYGTRLEKDFKESGEFQELIGRPKALLPIKDKALISFWFDELEETNEVFIVTNDKFQEQFYKSRKWYAPNFGSEIKIFNDGSCSNETRLGAVADIKFGLDKAGESVDDLLVIAGDTLFSKTFKLTEFVTKFYELKEQNPSQPVALITDCPCPDEEVHKHGIIEVGENGRVTSFLEKPTLSETNSRSQSPCFYLLDLKCQRLLNDFLEETKNLPLAKRDATGHFLAYIVPRAAVYAFKAGERYDVGNLSSFKYCIQNH